MELITQKAQEPAGMDYPRLWMLAMGVCVCKPHTCRLWLQVSAGGRRGP